MANVGSFVSAGQEQNVAKQLAEAKFKNGRQAKAKSGGGLSSGGIGGPAKFSQGNAGMSMGMPGGKQGKGSMGGKRGSGLGKGMVPGKGGALGKLKMGGGGGGKEDKKKLKDKSLMGGIAGGMAGKAEDYGMLGKVGQKFSNLAQKAIGLGTRFLLYAAWALLLPTLGLSLAYIIAHGILSYVFGRKIFCRLGEEWAFVIKIAAIIGTGGAAVAAASNAPTGAFGFVEWIVVAILACVVGALWTIIFGIAGAINAVGNPLQLIWDTVSSVF
jgi:hypothetical protein